MYEHEHYAIDIYFLNHDMFIVPIKNSQRKIAIDMQLFEEDLNIIRESIGILDFDVCAHHVLQYFL
jgi:hypothetical protein